MTDRKIASITFTPTGEVRAIKLDEFAIDHHRDGSILRCGGDWKGQFEIATCHIRYVGDPPVLDPEVRRAIEEVIDYGWAGIEALKEMRRHDTVKEFSERLKTLTSMVRLNTDPPKPEESLRGDVPPSTAELIVGWQHGQTPLQDALNSIDRRLAAMEKKA